MRTAPRRTIALIEVEAESAIAEVDAPKVERIVENLLANAVKHTPAGTTIRVRVESVDGGVLIAVDDRGPGVAAEQAGGRSSRSSTAATRDGHASREPASASSLVAQFTRAARRPRVGRGHPPEGGSSFRVFLPSAQPSSS